MVPAAQLAALGRTGEAATLLPRSHFRRATNLSRERLSVPEARDVPGHSEHARFRASARLDPGVLVFRFPCPRGAHIVLSCLLCLCASSKPLKSGASLSSLTQGAPPESLVHARGFNANYRPISGRGRVPERGKRRGQESTAKIPGLYKNEKLEKFRVGHGKRRAHRC